MSSGSPGGHVKKGGKFRQVCDTCGRTVSIWAGAWRFYYHLNVFGGSCEGVPK